VLAPPTSSRAWNRQSIESATDWRLEAPLVDPRALALDLQQPAARERLQQWVEASLRPTLRRRGIALVQGPVPTPETEDRCVALYRAIGESLGELLPQSVRGELLYSVRAEGAAAGSPTARGAKGDTYLDFHTDAAPAWLGSTPTTAALLALEVDPGGGDTLVVSAETIHDAIARSFPDTLPRLFEDYLFDRRAELVPGTEPLLRAPVFRRVGEDVLVRYALVYMCRGHDLAGSPLQTPDLLPLFVMTFALQDRENQLRFHMEKGQMLFLDNQRTLHGRQPFSAQTERPRHLLRMWIQSAP
jgi:alpha-ketoglutarate-dependent taurine dioxygenase